MNKYKIIYFTSGYVNMFSFLPKYESPSPKEQENKSMTN